MEFFGRKNNPCRIPVPHGAVCLTVEASPKFRDHVELRLRTSRDPLNEPNPSPTQFYPTLLLRKRIGWMD